MLLHARLDGKESEGGEGGKGEEEEEEEEAKLCNCIAACNCASSTRRLGDRVLSVDVQINFLKSKIPIEIPFLWESSPLPMNP
jgi:hypothetical protein